MEEQTADIEVTVKTLDSQSRTYTVGAQLTVKEFKEHIAPSVGIPVDKQRLIYQGRVLQDDRTLTDYNVDGKVIHLVERAPPPPSQPGSGSGGTSSDSGPSSSSQGTSQVPPHDRNANSYVMLGTFNLPVNIMDPQQIQMSVQQMVSGMGENARNARVTTSTGSNGSVNVHIDMDQPVQSEPRLRLVLAENLLRDINDVIQRMEGRPTDSSAPTEAAAAPPPPSSSSTNSTPSPSAQPMDTSPPPTTPPPPTTSSAQAEGPTPHPGPNHPSPAELAEMLSELRRVEERLQPFIQRAHTILETATTAEYNNNAEREEDQRTLILTWECLRLLGNALVALSDLRLNLMSPVPRHLHVVRPFSHYATPVTLPGAVHHHIPVQMNLGATVTVAANGTEGQAPSTQAASQSEQAGQGQTPPTQTSPSNQQAGPGQAGPRVIRISHQAVPVVMMQMNTDGSGANPTGAGQQMPGQPGALPPDFMRNLMQQISQYAAAVATSAATATGHPAAPQPTPPGYSSTANSSTTTTGPNTPTTTPTAPPPPPHTGPQARVVFTRPPFAPNMPTPAFGTRGTTINVRAAMPGQQPGQVGIMPFNPAALNQMISGLVGQLLLPGQMPGQTVTSSSSTSTSSSASFSSSSQTSSASSSFSFSNSGPTPPPTANTTNPPSQSETNTSEPQAQEMPPDLSQLLGSLLGVAGGASGGPAGAPSITVTTSGVPAFIQGVSEFMQQAQPIFSAPPPPAGATPAPAAGPNPTPNPPAGAEALNPELFTGIVRGVLSTMMGSLGQAQNDTESIAQFMQRLSQATNIFISPEDPTGFFGELLMLVCQTFTMSDLVMLLHGQHQPLGRIQPQLSQFFTQNYLNGREPTDENITAAAESLVNELEEYISESFRESSVTVLEGVDVTQTNMSFFRQQLMHIATHILRCTDDSFGPRLLQMCNQALFECLALNLHCLRGDQRALTAVINHRIRRMSSDISPSLVNWMTSMMTMRLQVILEHIPISQEQIQNYIVHTQAEQSSATGSQEPERAQSATVSMIGDTLSPAAATTAEEAMSVSHDTRPLSRETRAGDLGASGGAAPLGGDMAAAGAEGGSEESARESETWAAAVPPEWVPIIRCDMMTQRKMKAQPPLSDAYLHGMPAKRRKTGLGGGSLLSLSDAVSQAARTAGVKPITSAERLQDDLETQELKEAYAEQVKADIKKRVREDPDFNSQHSPNAHRAFSSDS
ncbi:large proline-rich protein BAG6 isoform X1 [Clinocottus analis]|uniref:large proline-rich protein BAG6 isoform X1 n=1 Tax=Clinocottus analis TaxID=304258 RepID=UPI0035C1A192